MSSVTMVQSAIVDTTRNKDFIEYFTGLIKGREREQGIKTKMRVKVTAKMLVIAWTLLKKGEKFQPEYLLKERKLQSFHINGKTIFGENTPGNNVEAYMDLVGDNYGALTELCNLDKG